MESRIIPNKPEPKQSRLPRVSGGPVQTGFIPARPFPSHMISLFMSRSESVDASVWECGVVPATKIGEYDLVYTPGQRLNRSIAESEIQTRRMRATKSKF